MTLMAIFAPLLAPHVPLARNQSARTLPPVWSEGGTAEYLLGTDQNGRGCLSRLIYGTRISITIGIGAATIGLLIGVTAGFLAGYFGGWVDHVISILLTAQLALPGLLPAIARVFIIGPSIWVVIGANLMGDRLREVAENLGTMPQVKHLSGRDRRIGFLILDAGGLAVPDGPMTNLNVRRAVAHAIDPEEIAAALIGGAAAVIEGACHPSELGCNQDVTTYPYDPEKARALLARIGRACPDCTSRPTGQPPQP